MDQKTESKEAIIKEKIKENIRPASRYISKSLKKEIVIRAQKSCEFKSTEGHRCHERRNLQFEHVIPFAKRRQSYRKKP